jgi:hypothetical protein
MGHPAQGRTSGPSIRGHAILKTSKQLIAETPVPILMKPGRPARCDYKYERNRTATSSRITIPPWIMLMF